MIKDVEVIDIYYDYALQSKHDVICLVGGRNSGKSHFMEQLTTIKTNNKKNYKMVVVTGVETNVEAGVKEGITDRIEEFGRSSLYSATKQPPVITHKNGNQILFKGYKSKQQQKKFKELKKVTACWYEEAEDITYEQLKALQNQLRGGSPQDRQIFLSLNPVNPDGFIDKTFFQVKPDNVFESFEDGRPKVFEVDLPVDLGEKEYNISVLVICTTHHDNPYLTDGQRAAIEEYKTTRPDLYSMLAECKFVYPKGTLIKDFKKFSLNKVDLSQVASIKAVVDTASSGEDAATLGIYGKINNEKYYLLEAIENSSGADDSIDEFVKQINKYKPQEVYVEENHEGLYFKDKIDTRTSSNIFVKGFRSTENKHEKILSQSGRMKEHLYIRDDGSANYNLFIQNVKRYNRDEKKNKHDDCIDNIAMYFKHVDNKDWSFF